jgi:translation initiation factor 5B
MAIRQPIVTVAGHVDHGKTSILDRFRGSSVQEGEAGGITQKISFTKYPLEKLKKVIGEDRIGNLELDIPGFLFIDTPGHAAFTNLRKRGGSLADLAIVVVSVNEGIMPQTAEVLQILKASKTPFVVALNKIDQIGGWTAKENLIDSLSGQATHAAQQFQEKALVFQGALQSHGFQSELFHEVKDFTKEVAIVPCSAETGEGIPELLLTLAGLSEKFLKEGLKLGSVAKGVVLEVRKEKGMSSVEAIVYDGVLREGEEIMIAGFDDPVKAKVRAIEEVGELSFSFGRAKEVSAATGVRLQLTSTDGVVSGMPFEVGSGKELEDRLKKEVGSAVKTDKQGIIAKADSLGSLEALLTLLKQEGISVVRAGIGPIGKSDLVSAKANLDINELDAVIVGFNVEAEDGLVLGKTKVIAKEVVYQLIEELKEWRTERAAEIEREKLMGLATVGKLEILGQYVFRNSNPAIFGIRVVGGNVKKGARLIDEAGEEVARVKALQKDQEQVDEAGDGEELAVSLPGTNFERRIKGKDVKHLYVDVGVKEFKKFKAHKDLLSKKELEILEELARIKSF